MYLFQNYSANVIQVNNIDSTLNNYLFTLKQINDLVKEDDDIVEIPLILRIFS